MAVVVGTAGIILQAPSLYDDRSPIDKELSDIGQQVEEILSTIHLYFGSRLPIIQVIIVIDPRYVEYIQLTPFVSCFRMATDRTLKRSGLEELEPHANADVGDK